MKIPAFKNLVLFENSDFIVVNKPAGIASLDDRNDDINLKKLAEGYADNIHLGHRLDKETSGALVIAKSEEAYRHLALQFEHRQVGKVYHAVVNGIHDFQGTMVDKPILPGSNGLVRIDAKGKPSQTVFETLKVFRNCSLIDCRPITGRTHQIRIHLSCIKAPIVADQAYGGDDIFLSSFKRDFKLKKWTEELPMIKRVALHAQKVIFKGLGDESIDIQAPYPKDFGVLIKQLTRYS